jgi:DNA-binding winged helix-turn-helix (wHTH) protein
MSLNLSLVFPEFRLRVDKSSRHKVYTFGDFRLDGGDRMLYRDGEMVPLAPKAVETLLALVDRSGQIVSKDELLETVWPDTTVEESNLFLYLSLLRKALGPRADGKPWIETLRRRGYKFTGEVRVEGRGPEGEYRFHAADELAELTRWEKEPSSAASAMAGPVSSDKKGNAFRYIFLLVIGAIVIIAFATSFYWNGRP